MWEYRRRSVDALGGSLQREGLVIESGFAVLDAAIARLSAQPQTNAYARTFALVLVKARHLAFACFTLALDGLGQEAGAILRLWIEAIELLHYLSTDSAPPSRLERVWKGSLPSAGNIAKKIGGHFHALRNMLSETAAHFSMKPESVRHFVESQTGEIRCTQEFNEVVLRANLATCFYFLYFSSVEARNAVGASGVAHEDIAAQVDSFIASGGQVFPIVPPSAA